MRNWKPFGAVIIAAVVFFATASFAFESSALGEKVESRNYRTGDFVPTAVAGESWLNHLQRTFNETSMGKTGRVGPPPTTAGEESARWQMSLAPEPMKETVTLRGSDLYRMNCRGCHGEDGQGAPPEINSVINPVRATSVAAIMERMKMAGMDISRSDAAIERHAARTAASRWAGYARVSASAPSRSEFAGCLPARAGGGSRRGSGAGCRAGARSTGGRTHCEVDLPHLPQRCRAQSHSATAL